MEVHRVHGVIGVDQVAEVRDHFVGVQATLENLSSRAQREWVQPAQCRGVVRDGFDGEQSFVHEAIDYRRLGTRSGDLENPLPDRKLMRDGCRPNRRVVDRHVAHSEGGEASVQKFAFHQSGCTSMLSIVVRKEEVADAEVAGAEI